MQEPKNLKYLLFGGTFILANKLQFVGDKMVNVLTTKQWFLLLNILDLSKEGVPTVTSLASAMDTSRQNIAKMLESMEKTGLVEVVTSVADKRVRQVSMTPFGMSQVKIAENEAQYFLREVFSGLSEDELALGSKVMLKMMENLEQLKGNFK
ncbi:MAG: MarR family transcriptional regulator [Streptococcaceae bacterium]|jgi:DNA-binding MarR family transcriptional regulator|nr:MarR family transcriptional regulator [Streptococcaceae bacterium]